MRKFVKLVSVPINGVSSGELLYSNTFMCGGNVNIVVRIRGNDQKIAKVIPILIQLFLHT